MNTSEIYNLYSLGTAPVSLISTIVCGIAAITSYIYPQQRKFPNVVLVWTCVNDFWFTLYISMSWLPGIVKDKFTNHAMMPGLCTFTLYSQWAMQQSASMLSLLLAYTLYATIVRRIDLYEMRSKYYWRYIVTYWFPTLTVPLLCLTELRHNINPGFCSLSTSQGILFRVGSYYLPFVIQIVIMVPVFRRVRIITHAVRHSVTDKTIHNNTIFWLTSRFIGAQINQVIVWFPGTIWNLIVLQGGNPGPILTYITAFTPGLLAINGAIVIAGNKQLKESLFSIYVFLRTRFGPVKSSPKKFTNSTELTTSTLT